MSSPTSVGTSTEAEQSKTSGIKFDLQFKNALSNYLSSRPYADVASVMTALNEDRDVSVELLNEMQTLLMKEVAVRLSMAVQQANLALRNQSASASGGEMAKGKAVEVSSSSSSSASSSPKPSEAVVGGVKSRRPAPEVIVEGK